MANPLLDSIEWHDLPLASLSLSDRGVALVVTPWLEATDTYARYSLQIADAESIKLDVTGALSPIDFTNLELSKFEYTVGLNDRITGTIGILPGEAGYWAISFANATWSFEAV